MSASLWDRQDGEGTKPYTAFTVFLNLKKPRTLGAVSQELSKSLPLIKRWSKDWKWFARAEAYDADMARAEHQARREARAEAAGDSELEAYRDRTKKNGELIGGLARAAAGVTAKAIQKLEDGEPIPSSISTAIRAVSQGLQTEADLMAIVVGVDDMIGAFTRGAGQEVD